MTFIEYDGHILAQRTDRGGFTSLAGINSVLSQIARKGGCSSEEKDEGSTMKKNIWKTFLMLLFEFSFQKNGYVVTGWMRADSKPCCSK